MKIKVLIADDQEVVRKGIAALLSYQSDLVVVGTAAHGEEAVAMARDFAPDVVLMDLRMPVLDGIAATAKIKQLGLPIKVLVLTTFDDDELIIDSLKAGASGYLLKDTPSEEITSAIRTIHNGNILLSPTAAAKLVANAGSRETSQDRRNLKELLTTRELEVLKLIGEGKNNKEIAAALNITEGTVKNHVSHIFAQIDARDRIQAALIARQGLGR